MELLIQFSLAIGGIFVSVISYFLKKTMSELTEVKKLSYTTKSELDILKTDYTIKHTHLTEKFEELKLALRDLTKEVSNLNKILASK
jgi:hypothetical protein